jgi:hypothetical protein
MEKVTVLKAFDAYPKGNKPVHYPVGDAEIPRKLIEDCNMVKNGLVRLSSKEKPEARS